MKKGLILEGGGMRGLFSAGVIDVFMENGIEFDAAIGVSAGAAFGSNYKSRQPGRVIRYNKRFAKDPRFCSLRSLIKTGDLFGAEFCYHTIPDTIDIFDTDAYLENPMDFYVVVTDVETGKAVYVNSDVAGDDALEFFRASASMPIVSRPVEIRGKKYGTFQTDPMVSRPYGENAPQTEGKFISGGYGDRGDRCPYSVKQP